MDKFVTSLRTEPPGASTRKRKPRDNAWLRHELLRDVCEIQKSVRVCSEIKWRCALHLLTRHRLPQRSPVLPF